MSLFFLKDELYKIAGIAVVAAGTLLLILGLFGFFTGINTGQNEDLYLGIIISASASALIAGGVNLYRAGKKLSQFEDQLKLTAALIKTYRRISVPDIAEKMSITETEAMKLLNTAVSMGMIKGNMDRGTGEFFVSDSLSEIKKISFCPYCGSPLGEIVYSGETVKCPGCGSMIF
jgi:DNA-directed RNA polymerase subunit RPC12/RpoP/nitrogen fixation-related uncharacterized protein